jgi:hypothetical protein
VRARQLSQDQVATSESGVLLGSVLLAAVTLASGTLRKGTTLDAGAAASLVEAAQAGKLTQGLRLAWPDPDDMHEDQAAMELAVAAAGPGVVRRPPRQSRLDLVAKWDGVLHLRTESLIRLNTIDSLELFTLLQGQAVQAGQVVASVKVAPHLIPAAVVHEGVQIARDAGPLVEVRPYLTLQVGALVVETVSEIDLARFEAGARLKVESLGSRFAGTMVLNTSNPEGAERSIREALKALVTERSLSVVLVGGVSAGDPLAPFYDALESLGGRVLRHGVPAHPGSMIWLAELGDSRLLGLPQCGMFTLATAADLILPRLLTGERLTAGSLAELAHGGVLTREMRFRFPPYAQNLEAPEG